MKVVILKDLSCINYYFRLLPNVFVLPVCSFNWRSLEHFPRLSWIRGKALEHRQRRKQKEGETETYKKKLEVVWGGMLQWLKRDRHLGAQQWCSIGIVLCVWWCVKIFCDGDVYCSGNVRLMTSRLLMPLTSSRLFCCSVWWHHSYGRVWSTVI